MIVDPTLSLGTDYFLLLSAPPSNLFAVILLTTAVTVLVVSNWGWRPCI